MMAFQLEAIDYVLNPKQDRPFTKMGAVMTWDYTMKESTKRWAIDVAGGDEHWAHFWPLRLRSRNDDVSHALTTGPSGAIIPDLARWDFPEEAVIGIAISRNIDRGLVWFLGLARLGEPVPLSFDDSPEIVIEAPRWVWTEIYVDLPPYRGTVPTSQDGDEARVLAMNFKSWYVRNLAGRPLHGGGARKGCRPDNWVRMHRREEEIDKLMEEGEGVTEELVGKKIQLSVSTMRKYRRIGRLETVNQIVKRRYPNTARKP
jgi:hypothetical protein